MESGLRHCALGLLLGALLGCSNGDGIAESAALIEGSLDFESYDWDEISMGRRWDPRAGLRALELDGRFYVMGGRTPRPPMGPFPIPGDSDLWADVWASDDLGQTWQLLLGSEEPGHWSPRAYFQAVVNDGWMYVIGGQNFIVVDNPLCAGLPPESCPAFTSVSDFFNDVWRSRDGINWEQMTAAAPWPERAGLSAVVLNGEIYVLAGSQNDDSAIVGGPPVREYFNDVWKSTDGREWELLIDAAPWEPRAGAIVVTLGSDMYLLGGEDGFVCAPLPDCEPPYFNDVWRSADGANWELVTAAAGWSPRPGHQCGVISGNIICFGGFGLVENPVDVWTSADGALWTLLSKPPWNATAPEQIKYDFDVIVRDPALGVPEAAIYTFGGDRETFDFFDPLNYLRVDDDVWRFAPPDG